eukprot:2562076-Prymnesium_polylepis.1
MVSLFLRRAFVQTAVQTRVLARQFRVLLTTFIRRNGKRDHAHTAHSTTHTPTPSMLRYVNRNNSLGLLIRSIRISNGDMSISMDMDMDMHMDIT